MPLAGLALTTAAVQPLLSRFGFLQSPSRPAPGLPQRSTAFTQGVEDVEGLLDLEGPGVASPGVVEFQPLTQARAVVADDGSKVGELGELLGPGQAVAGGDLLPGDPAEALRLDDHDHRAGSRNL